MAPFVSLSKSFSMFSTRPKDLAQTDDKGRKTGMERLNGDLTFAKSPFKINDFSPHGASDKILV